MQLHLRGASLPVPEADAHSFPAERSQPGRQAVLAGNSVSSEQGHLGSHVQLPHSVV